MIMRVRLGLLKNYINENYTWILSEGRVEDAREKYPKISDDDFKKIVDGQPSGSNNKYLLWACKQVDDGSPSENVVQAVTSFDTNRQRLEKKDINQYKDVSELLEAIEKLGGKSKSQIAKQAASDTDIIYQDQRFLVLRPHTTEAACKYGVRTKWCIAATTSKNYFSSYSSSNNKFYFVIDKTATAGAKESKYAIAVISLGRENQTQVYDASDKLVPLSTVATLVGTKWNDVWSKIQTHIKQKPTTREVDDAKKAAEEHVKAFLKGEKITVPVFRKISREGELTIPLVAALIKHVNEADDVEWKYESVDLISAFAQRILDMSPEAATLVVKWITGMQTNNDQYAEHSNFGYIIQHANLPLEVFHELASKGSEFMLGNLMSNVNLPADIRMAIAANVDKFTHKENKRKIFLSMIKNGDISLDQMHEAMKSDYYLNTIVLDNAAEIKLPAEYIRLIPVHNQYALKLLMNIPNVPEDYVVKNIIKLWSTIKKNDLYEMLKTIKLSPDGIETLWNSKGIEAQLALLQNPIIGVENLKKFARNKNSAYRFSVAHNVMTAIDDLDVLSTDESASTRSAVAANPNTKTDTLKQLAGDSAIVVRASVAGNSATPNNILSALKRDSDEFVRKTASKTLKLLQTTELAIRTMMRVGSLLLEDLNDDETPDLMTPGWRDIPNINSVTTSEFVAIFLLQNNGHATREEISKAYEDWKGVKNSNDVWRTFDRGTTVGGMGWWWSPKGIDKGALFRITPAGSSAALEVLQRIRSTKIVNPSVITNITARPGRKYYTKTAIEAIDVTKRENLYIKKIHVKATQPGEPVKNDDGSLIPVLDRRVMTKRGVIGYRGPKTNAYELTPIKDNGKPDKLNIKYVLSMPTANLPANSEVEFIRSNYNPFNGRIDDECIVKYKGKSYIVPFPLWAQPNGAEPVTQTPGVMPPVRKSPPPAALTKKISSPVATTTPDEESPVATTATPVRRGPKSTYKIYGKFKGHPAATRLKGQAYVAADDTQFKSGEQAIIEPEDGKLRVKKTAGDHSQLWSPIDG